MTDLSIIIVSYKGWERLVKCLGALNSFTGKNYSTEVIVIDNSTDDETIYKIEKKFPKFRFIRNEINGGYANGCNLGGKNATGEFFLVLNPDTVASESELEKLLNTAKKNPSFTILSCRQVNENRKECIDSGSFPQLYNLTGFQRIIFRKGKSGKNVEKANPQAEVFFPDWISGSVVLMRKEIFQKLGGFDEDFWMYYEDVDLCRRVRNMGGEIAFCRNVTIEHYHGGSSRINLKTTSLTKTEVYISRHIYINKHKSGSEKLLIQVFLIINNLISCSLMALLGIILFFVPKVFARTLICFRLISYYAGAILRLSWISPRSVNFHK